MGSSRRTPPTPRPPRFRLLEVAPAGRGLRLDLFLSRWFPEYSRSALARGVRDGLVTDEGGRVLRASQTLRGGERLRLYLPGIAPKSDPPPFPTILHEDDRVVVVDKPPGLLTHPAGNDFAWAVVSLAKERWPHADLVHRIDKDTSGVLVVSKDADANRTLKAAFVDDRVDKVYEAIVRGRPAWDSLVMTGPIGPADGPIRIQMAVRADGLEAHTEATVLERHATADLARVRCRITTGRTHQIRVHLASAGHSILGDRMYGVPPDVFLHAWEQGEDDSTVEAAGAPRHALHAAWLRMPHPDGGVLEVSAPVPEDMRRWWARPEVLPFDREDVPADDDAKDPADEATGQDGPGGMPS